ncbi:type II toxin-antitoxin system HicB family antitoxin [Comamonas faecalis]|uniref:Type II toxin-antitoxin system HicB family antitoxin n=1 Tax=Comamonas faecalis TaxID=1387849 RepID=A0ABP7R2E4_9BURK
MNNTLTHKGLTARVEFDADDGILWGKVLGLPDHLSITFEGETARELRQDFERAVDFYLQECARTGAEPLKPASGKLMLRVAPEVHSAALIAAQAAGVSLNQWAARVLSQAAHA